MATERKPTQLAGARLVADLSRDDDPYAITVMVVESGRIADRLEKLAALLAGECSSWLELRIGRDQVTEVRVDNALGEARHQATTLRGLLAEIHRQRAGIPMLDDDDDDLAGI
jgi:hypothetical protein